MKRRYEQRLLKLLSGLSGVDELANFAEQIRLAIKKGRYVEAVKAAREAQLFSESQFGEGHALVALFRYAAFDALCRAGNAEEAAADFTRLINILVFDISMKLPAGSSDAAELIDYCFEQALSQRRTRRPFAQFANAGENLKSLSNLSVALLQAKQNDQAVRVMRSVYKARRQVLGKRHDDTLLAAHKLGVYMGMNGDPQGSAALLAEAFKLRRRKHGFAHLLTIRSANSYAAMAYECGKKRTALKLARQAYQESIDLLGEDHEQTQRVLATLQQLESPAY